MNIETTQLGFQTNIANEISVARKKLNMTQSDLATAIGTNQSSIARMEAGNQNFTAQMLERLSQVLGENFISKSVPDRSIKIIGNKPLKGTVGIQGAKNAALPAIAAALLPSKGTTVLKNIPNIQDVHAMLEIAESLGAKIKFDVKGHTVTINAENISTSKIPFEQANKIRTCILFLSSLLYRTGRAQLPAVGGCNIGERKTDFHYRGFARLGAEVKTTSQYLIDAKATKLKGSYIYLDTPSHTGTENLLIASCIAEGDSIIDNAASDPEVVDLANMLVKMGAQISGIGTRTLYVTGVKELKAVEYTIIPDRHDFISFAVATAITEGKVTLKNAIRTNQLITDAKLQQMGVNIEYQGTDAVVSVPTKLKPINLITYPYPGFPTDAQPLMTALATLAEGKSFIRETIFEDRFGYVDYLNDMGADIVISKNNVIIVEGVPWLDGGTVKADDIRAGFGLIAAGLAAKGETIINNAYQIERGYENFVERLKGLGADISVVS